MKPYRSITMVAALMCMFFHGIGQAFEGMITLTVSDNPGKSSVLKVKDNKSVLEIQLDSSEGFKIIKNRGAETLIVLRSKDELKYGYRSSLSVDENEVENTIESQKEINCEIKDETRLTGEYKSFRVVIQNDNAIAEAWVTKDLGFPLSKFFPEFISHNIDPVLTELRERADRLGFVMWYSEKMKGSDNEIHFEIQVDEKEISIEEFATHGYLVLDQDGLTRLYTDSMYDVNKKKQWNEFMQLFGKK